MSKDLSRYYQVLTLKFDDGRSIDVVVQAICDPESEPIPGLVSMGITQPIPVPPGLHFGSINPDNCITLSDKDGDSIIGVLPDEHLQGGDDGGKSGSR